MAKQSANQSVTEAAKQPVQVSSIEAYGFGCSHPGCVRPNNEDSFAIGDLADDTWKMAGGALDISHRMTTGAEGDAEEEGPPDGVDSADSGAGDSEEIGESHGTGDDGDTGDERDQERDRDGAVAGQIAGQITDEKAGSKGPARDDDEADQGQTATAGDATDDPSDGGDHLVENGAEHDTEHGGVHRGGDHGRDAGGTALHLIPGERGIMAVVCDGMGGAAAGDLASSLATKALWEEMHQSRPTDDRIVYARLLRRAVRVANRRVWEHSRQDMRLRGMGTTLSAAGLVGHELVVAQIGDSRAYILRGDHLVQITRDQSIAYALMQVGQLSEEEIQQSPFAHTILQALGVRRDVEVALSVVELRRGDRLLICSDGLHGCVNEEQLQAMLTANPTDTVRTDPVRTVEQLLGAALEAGGPDNITMIVADFTGEGLPEVAGPDDLPSFIEIDPMEEGEQALANTSVVARRLAAQVGIGEDPGPTVVPATGQHVAPRRATRIDFRESSGANMRVRVRHLWPWILLFLLVSIAGVYVLWLLWPLWQ